jgi:hypothetical protein
MPGNTKQQNSHEDNNQSPYLESASQAESTGRPTKKNATEERMQERTTRAIFMNGGKSAPSVFLLVIPHGSKSAHPLKQK